MAKVKALFNTMKTITIPDPVALAAWLDEQIPSRCLPHRPTLSQTGWFCMHWQRPSDYVVGNGETPEELLADIRAKVAASDPLAKIRKQAEALGYGLLKLPED